MSGCQIDKNVIRPIRFFNGACQMLDQRRLPAEEIWLDYSDYQGVAEAIRSMVVRGAPAIGVAAAIGTHEELLASEPRYRTLLEHLEEEDEE